MDKRLPVPRRGPCLLTSGTSDWPAFSCLNSQLTLALAAFTASALDMPCEREHVEGMTTADSGQHSGCCNVLASSTSAVGAAAAASASTAATATATAAVSAAISTSATIAATAVASATVTAAIVVAAAVTAAVAPVDVTSAAIVAATVTSTPRVAAAETTRTARSATLAARHHDSLAQIQWRLGTAAHAGWRAI
jgi:hypothetical protein